MTVDVAIVNDDTDADIVALSTGTRRFQDSQVRKVVGWIDQSPLLERVTQWKVEARRGPGGRRETFSLRALLVSMVLGAISHQPPLASTFTEIMFLQMSPTMRAELGIPEPKTPFSAGSIGHKIPEHLALYRNVRTRLNGTLALMDPSPFPKNRRLGREAFAAAVARRSQRLCNEDLALYYDRLNWFLNEIVEMSIKLLPREVRRRWKGSVAVDATAVRAYARPSRPRHGKSRWKKTDEIEVYSADPDAAMYKREAARYDDDDGPPGNRKSFWGYEATFVVAGPDDPESWKTFPNVVVAMPPLHQPSREPGLNAVRALQSLQQRGHPAGSLAGDRAYTDAKPENFALRAKAMGYRVILDYAIDHLGVQGSHNGFLFVEGAWYCPAIPTVLVNATVDYRNDDIDDATYRSRLAERMRYRALTKANEDVEGHRRWRCPASNPNPGASCPLKPASQHHDGRVMVTIRPSTSLQANPPSCCVQGSVTIPPEPMAKLRQDLPYGTLEWEARYHALRNTIEGMNGYLKDGAREALDDSQRRRIRGVVAQSVFVALLVFAANYRKIVAFMRLVGVEGGSRRRPRRRASRPISDWYPTPARVPHGPEPPPSL